MTEQLNRLNVNREAILGASAPERTGIMHFGLGNFHRAHAAVNTALAMAAEPGDWGIVGIGLLTGQDPMQILGQLAGQMQQGTPTQTQTGPRPAANDEGSQFVASILGDTEDTWRAIFAQAGKLEIPGIVLACDMKPVVVTKAPREWVELKPRNIELENVERLRRIDFVCAGTLFNILVTLQAQGKLVTLFNVNAMVAALLRVMSVDQVAHVTLRH